MSAARRGRKGLARDGGGGYNLLSVVVFPCCLFVIQQMLLGVSPAPTIDLSRGPYLFALCCPTTRLRWFDTSSFRIESLTPKLLLAHGQFSLISRSRRINLERSPVPGHAESACVGVVRFR